MNLQLQNWHNFCRYHAGEWYGINTRYSPKAEAINSWEIFTKLEISKDHTQINHQDYLTYADGTTELKTFSPYIKPITSALFLDNSFCWGTRKIESSSTFVLEIGLRAEDRRVLALTKYDNSGSLEYLAIAPQLLGMKVSKQIQKPVANKVSNNWQGTLKTIKPDWTVSEPIAVYWKPLKELNPNYLTLHFMDNISVSCPGKITMGEKFFVAVDWLINPALLQRGVGYYDRFGFSRFTLEIFTPGS